MPLDVLDRAAAILATEAVIALPLRELAARTGAPSELLAGRLRDDRRFVLYHPHRVAELELLAEEGRAAYRAALERAGLSDEPAVAVVGSAATAAGPVADLLRATVIALLASDAESPVAATAPPLHRALRVSLGSVETGPSTTPPPCPPRPSSIRPSRPPPPRHRPPCP
jgi:hypothetical protein